MQCFARVKYIRRYCGGTILYNKDEALCCTPEMEDLAVRAVDSAEKNLRHTRWKFLFRLSYLPALPGQNFITLH